MRQIESPYNFAELYHFFTKDECNDARFYLQLLGSEPRDVLDVCCGTGRLTAYFACMGHSVVGVDNSVRMLEVAARASSHTRAKYIACDARSIDLPARFDFAFLANNGILHFLSEMEAEKLLRAMRSHLRSGGRLVLDVPFVSAELLSEMNGEAREVASKIDPAGAHLCVLETPLYQAECRHCVRRFDLFCNGVVVATSELTLRMYFPDEIESIIGHAGFIVEERLGDYVTKTATESNCQWVYICRVS